MVLYAALMACNSAIFMLCLLCRQKHHGHSNAVHLNDVFFAVHAAVLAGFTLIQCFIYERGDQRVSKLCASAIALTVSLSCVSFLLVVFDSRKFPFLMFLYWLSWVKMGVTFFKYMPQVRQHSNEKGHAIYCLAHSSIVHWQQSALVSVTILHSSVDLCVLCGGLHIELSNVALRYDLNGCQPLQDLVPVLQVWLNYKRQSTLGWNINQVLLDFSGGFFSVTQLCMEAFVKEDLSAIAGDPVKFGLGLVSVTFDIIFMIQHYSMYRENNAKLIEEAPKARYTMVSPDQSRQCSQQDEQPLLTASASNSVSEEGLSGPQPSKTNSIDTVALPTSRDQDHVV